MLMWKSWDYLRCVRSQRLIKTRMHSSRMRTVRCSSRLLGEGVVSARGCLPGGGGYLPRGVCPGGCLPHTSSPTPWTEWQTLWKYYLAEIMLRTVISCVKLCGDVHAAPELRFQTHFIGSVNIIGSVPLSVSVSNTVNHKDVSNIRRSYMRLYGVFPLADSDSETYARSDSDSMQKCYI